MPPHDVDDEQTRKITVSEAEEEQSDADEPIDVGPTSKLPSVKAVEEDSTKMVRVSEAEISRGEDSLKVSSGDDELEDRPTTKHQAVTRADAEADRQARASADDIADEETEFIAVSAGAPGGRPEPSSDDIADEETEYIRVGDADVDGSRDASLVDAETEDVPVAGDEAEPESAADSGAITQKQGAVDASDETPLYVGSPEFSDAATDYVDVDASSADSGGDEASEKGHDDEGQRTVAVDVVAPVPGKESPDASGVVSSPDSTIDAQMRRLGMARSTPDTGSYPIPDDPTGGFYTLPDANQAAIEGPRSPRQNLMRATFLAVVVAIVAAPFVAYMASDRWMELPIVMLAMLLATAVPGVSLGVASVWPANRRPSSTTVLIGVIPGLIMSILLTSVAATWALPEVRLVALGLTHKPATVMERVLRDDSVPVASAACRTLLPRVDIPKWRRTILGGMTLRPEVAAQCLEGVDEELAARLGRGVLGRWQSELMAAAEEPDEERLCTLANEITALPVTVSEQDARLLQCTMGARTAVAQRCCADALTASLGENKRERLNRIRATIPETPGSETALGLLNMAFESKRLSEGQKKFAAAAKFKGDDARGVAIEVACAQLQSNPDIALNIAAALEGECEVDVGEIPSGRELWDDICAETVTVIERNPPLRTLCRATRAELVDLAAHAASGAVRYGIQVNIRKGHVADVEDILPPVSRDELDDPESFLKSSWVGDLGGAPRR